MGNGIFTPSSNVWMRMESDCVRTRRGLEGFYRLFAFGSTVYLIIKVVPAVNTHSPQKQPR